MQFRGQARQDEFVCNVLKNKANGFFVEVGSFHPIHINNTYLLETSLNWRGLMFEWEQDAFEALYKQHRPNSNYIFGDAQLHNFREIFYTHQVPQSVDYLQLDIEPPHKTLNVLKALDEQVMDEYRFSVITYEHDYCHKKNIIPRNESRKILETRGYYLVFEDICNKEPKWVYEDWYVHPDLVDMEHVKALQSRNRSHRAGGYGEITSTLNWQDIIYE